MKLYACDQYYLQVLFYFTYVEDNIKDDGQGLEKVKVKTLDEIKQDKQDLDNIKVKTLDEIKQEKQAQTKGMYS